MINYYIYRTENNRFFPFLQIYKTLFLIYYIFQFFLTFFSMKRFEVIDVVVSNVLKYLKTTVINLEKLILEQIFKQ